MNCSGETMKMGGPRAAQALASRAWQPCRGIGHETYLNSRSQGELVLSLSKEHSRTQEG